MYSIVIGSLLWLNGPDVKTLVNNLAAMIGDSSSTLFPRSGCDAASLESPGTGRIRRDI